MDRKSGGVRRPAAFRIRSLTRIMSILPRASRARGQCDIPLEQQGAKDLGTREGRWTRVVSAGADDDAADWGLRDHELDDCRGIKVCRRHQRSCRRRASRTLEGGSGAREDSGAGRSARLPAPTSRSPAARNRSSGVPAGGGESSATGRPRSVISIVSPRFDLAQQLARPLAQLSDPDRCQLLLVAHHSSTDRANHLTT